MIVSKPSTGHENIVQILIRAHADVNALDEDNWTPLYSASFAGTFRLFRVNKSPIRCFNSAF